jgi:diguanylate cyclase (GGDEF)-like protein
MKTANVRALTAPSLEIDPPRETESRTLPGGAPDPPLAPDGDGRAEDRRLTFLPKLAVGGAVVAIAMGVLGLLGWVAGIDFLRQVADDVRAIKPSTALGLIFLGAALLLIRTSTVTDERRAWARVLAELVVLGGVMVLVEYAADIELGIDAIFEDPTDSTYPGRPAPLTAVGAILLGLWLAVIDRPGPRWTQVENALAALSAIAILGSVIGYLYNANHVFGVGNTTGLAPQTLIGLVAIWVGTFVARPRGIWMRLLTSAGSGGHAIRRMIPVLVLVPIVCGGVVILGVENDWFDLRVGAAFVVATAVIVFVGISISTARELEALDAERHRLEERLTDLVERDPLTGVHNRRRLDEELRRELALSLRRGSPLTVMAVDLDRFKPTNDTWGHGTGDELLIATAQALTDELRTSDFVCRPGGDEFVVILPDTDDEAARIVAGKLIRTLRAIKRPRPGGGVIELSASIGIVTSQDGAWTEPSDLLAAADRALYAAKQAGGDRFAVDEGLVLDGG